METKPDQVATSITRMEDEIWQTNCREYNLELGRWDYISDFVSSAAQVTGDRRISIDKDLFQESKEFGEDLEKRSFIVLHLSDKTFRGRGIFETDLQE